MSVKPLAVQQNRLAKQPSLFQLAKMDKRQAAKVRREEEAYERKQQEEMDAKLYKDKQRGVELYNLILKKRLITVTLNSPDDLILKGMQAMALEMKKRPNHLIVSNTQGNLVYYTLE